MTYLSRGIFVSKGFDRPDSTAIVEIIRIRSSFAIFKSDSTEIFLISRVTDSLSLYTYIIIFIFSSNIIYNT